MSKLINSGNTLQNFFQERESKNQLCVSAKIAATIIKKRRISTGPAVYISPSGAVKCGGVAASRAKTLLVASSANTSAKMTTEITRTRTCKSWKD